MYSQFVINEITTLTSAHTKTTYSLLISVLTQLAEPHLKTFIPPYLVKKQPIVTKLRRTFAPQVKRDVQIPLDLHMYCCCATYYGQSMHCYQ